MSEESRHEEAYVSLMRGLRELDLCGPCAPSALVLTGHHAFPLAMNSRGQTLMAASSYCGGRIVVLGHEGYLASFPALVANAVSWLRGDGSHGDVSVGVHRHVQGVAEHLGESGFRVSVVGAFGEDRAVGVYVTDAYSVAAAADAKDLVAFLKAGGGVLMAGQAWSWAADHPTENALLQFGGNGVCGVAGVHISDQVGEAERLPVPPQAPSSWKALTVGKDFEDDLQFLFRGVSEFDLQGGVLASEVLVHGALSFPIGTTDDGKTFLAGSHYGQGRVVVVTHEAVLGRESMAPFWANALHWLDRGRQGVVGVAPNAPFNVLSQSGMRCERTDFREGLGVFVCTPYGDAHLQEIRQFVAEGGGLLLGGHAWYWAQSRPGVNELIDFPGNKLLNAMGLSLLKKTLDGGLLKVPVAGEPGEPAKESYHFRRMLRRFADHVSHGGELLEREEEHLRRLGADCVTFLHMKAHDCHAYNQVLGALTHIVMKSGMPQVCDSCPVESPKDHLLLSLGPEVYKTCPDPDALLPYLIKDNPPMQVICNQKVKIDVNTAAELEWISTGLYLSPGMKTYICMPAEIVNKEWKIQISCHTDLLWSDSLKRAACVHAEFPVDSEMMQVWNLWGGLIYLVAPPKTKVAGAEITVQMAVPAPYYKSGVTTAADWSLLRTAPAPWAELEFASIILTVPSDIVRSLDRPDELAALWDRMMRGVADLAAAPHAATRKERFVADVQISYGWMHAGYPIMANKSMAAELVSVEHIRSVGLWGPIHELGHNQQRACWEFPPNTTECTCNLWSVYVHEEVLGINREKAHPEVTEAARRKRREDYVKAGRIRSSWEMWVALETYLQLQEQFGWDAFKKVFAAYHEMSDFPKDNDGKMNLYAVTFSHTVGRDLSAFFKAWGWPVDTATEGKLSHLPPWSDHPMAQYD